MTTNKPLWTPSTEHVAASNMTGFMRQVNARHGVALNDYASLYRWSLDHMEDFWVALWDYTQVIAETRGERVLVDGDKMPGARFFPDARLNFAENLLRQRDDADAIVFWGESSVRRRLSYRQLYAEVSRLAQALKHAGVARGDRVAGLLPNLPETIIAALASASVGAVWTSCSSDFGVQGVLDRFGQVTPKVLFACDGYYYKGKTVDTLDVLKQVAAQLPSVQAVVVVPYVTENPAIGTIPRAIALRDFVAPFVPGEVAFERLPFNHPLVIMYSSGTTGVPKCIVHGAGATLLMHLKEHQLHCDIKPGDRVFYFTTCGWMMWNWLVTALASKATLLLYDGSPFVARGSILFDYADAERMTHFGTSAKFIDALVKIRAEACPRMLESGAGMTAKKNFEMLIISPCQRLL